MANFSSQFHISNCAVHFFSSDISLLRFFPPSSFVVLPFLYFPSVVSIAKCFKNKLKDTHIRFAILSVQFQTPEFLSCQISFSGELVVLSLFHCATSFSGYTLPFFYRNSNSNNHYRLSDLHSSHHQFKFSNQ